MIFKRLLLLPTALPFIKASGELNFCKCFGVCFEMTTRGQSNQEHASLFHDNDIFPVEMNQSQNYQLNYRVKLFDLLRALQRLTALFKNFRGP